MHLQKLFNAFTKMSKVTTPSLSRYSDTSVNRQGSWHFISYRFRHTKCYDMDIMFPFDDTLDLVLPATGKRITD
jgi:hypothetical protein